MHAHNSTTGNNTPKILDILIDYEDVNYAAEAWTHLLLQMVKEYISFKIVKIHPKDKKWINKDIKATISTCDRLYRQYQKYQEHSSPYQLQESES